MTIFYFYNKKCKEKLVVILIKTFLNFQKIITILKCKVLIISLIIRIQTWSKFSFFRRRWWFGKWSFWINCIPIIWCAILAFLITFWRFLITCWHFFITFWCWRFTPRHWQWRNLRIIIFPPNIFGKFSSIIIWINITGYSFSEYVFF